MVVYLNSGHDTESAAQMKEAMESAMGVHSVSIKVCSPPNSPSNKSIKWEKVSYVSNIQYNHDGIRTWRAYDIGPGKFIPWTKFNVPEESELPTMEVRPSTDKTCTGFVPLRPRQTGGQPLAAEAEDSSDSVDESNDTMYTANNSRFFACPEEECVKAFMRHSSRVKHLDCGKHKRALERKMLYDKATLEYATKLDCGPNKAPTVIEESRSLSSLSTKPTLPMGWALKSTQSRRMKFTDKQKQNLNSKFQIGESTGKKADPTDVSKATRTASQQISVTSLALPPSEIPARPA